MGQCVFYKNIMCSKYCTIFIKLFAVMSMRNKVVAVNYGAHCALHWCVYPCDQSQIPNSILSLSYTLTSSHRVIWIEYSEVGIHGLWARMIQSQSALDFLSEIWRECNYFEIAYILDFILYAESIPIHYDRITQFCIITSHLRHETIMCFPWKDSSGLLVIIGKCSFFKPEGKLLTYLTSFDCLGRQSSSECWFLILSTTRWRCTRR